MRAYLTSLVAIAVAAAPAQAANWNQQGSDVHSGAFVGARLNLSLGGKVPSKPRAGLTVAPTQSRISAGGRVTTRIGEGVALHFTSEGKPTITIAGVRADRALGLTSRGQVEEERKLGLSTGVWIGIGVVALAAVAYGAWFIHEVEDCNEHDDEC